MASRKPTLATLGQLIIARRGDLGVRAAAKEIGVSASTLSRVEGGHLPDLENFGLICGWLQIDPNQILGFSNQEDTEGRPVIASVHFKKKAAVPMNIAKALGVMIVRAQRAMAAEDDL